MDDWADLVGERLVIGLPGPTLREEDVALFRDTRAGGLILYRRNFEDPDQLAALVDGLEGALGRRLLVATDHEGGRVIMLGGGTTIFPDSLAVGRLGDAAIARRQGLIEARELRRLGVDVNLAPVLDVLTGAYSPNIGIRAYGADPALVGRLGAARVVGMAEGGLGACAKHFPGKGHAPVDAHLSLPRIPSTWAEMHATHLPPFMEAIAAGVECVMTSHPVYPNLDPSGVPATFSRLIVHDYLRGQLGFRGVVVSDDLEMGAVRETCPIGEAAVRAADAGHDLLLVCHTEAAQREAARALADAHRRGALPRRDLEQAVDRVRRLRARRPERRSGDAPGPEPGGAALAAEIAAAAVTVVRPGTPALAHALRGRVTAIVPRLSDLAPRITIELEFREEGIHVERALRDAGLAADSVVVGVEPTAAEIATAAARAAGADATVLFLFDAHLYPSNRALLAAVQGRARALAVVLLRDPWDAELLGPGVMGITAYGFRRCQLDAVTARLGRPAPGTSA